MVAVQVVSDLHLETHPSYADFELPVTASHLALLGDIGHVCDNDFLEWLRNLLIRYETVFYLFGNHDPYHMRLESAKSKMRTFAADVEKRRVSRGLGRFVFLDQTRYDLATSSGISVTILGCTLFSEVSREQAREVSNRLVDFRDLIDWDVGDHNEHHAEDVKWLDEETGRIVREAPDRKIIILTHYSPSTDPRTSSPSHARSTVASGFMTDLSDHTFWRNESVKVCAWGHSHFNFDFLDEQTGRRVVGNQKGYYVQAPSPSNRIGAGLAFQAGKTVEVRP